MSSTSGRRVILPLTNKSGGGVIAGDVVILDTANDTAFTTTTSAATTSVVGVVQETIANNATGRVAISGQVALVNVNASVTRGHFGATHTVAKQAASLGASRAAGAFCQFLTGGTTPSATLFGWTDISAGALTDHTHAATGSGATGGGATLSPVTLNLGTTTPAVTDGRLGWDASGRGILAYDSVRARPITEIGFAWRGFPPGFDATSAFGTAVNLAAVSAGNGGAMLIPIAVVAPMQLDSYIIRSSDTATARSAEARLYVSRLNNTATIDFVTGSDSTFSFTPAGASNRQSTTVSGAPVMLAPGFYWLVIRNTSGAQTFGIGTQAATFSDGKHATKSIAALGSTLDVITGWTYATAQPGAMLLGRLPDGTTL